MSHFKTSQGYSKAIHLQNKLLQNFHGLFHLNQETISQDHRKKINQQSQDL